MYEGPWNSRTLSFLWESIIKLLCETVIGALISLMNIDFLRALVLIFHSPAIYNHFRPTAVHQGEKETGPGVLKME